MTSKLLKYELRSSSTLMAIVWVTMILTSIMVTFFSQSMLNSDSGILNVLGVVPILLFAAACIAMAVGMVFIIIIRFYKSLMDDEGYLMHTLPVKEWQLITSKGLAATIYTIGCAIVLFIALAIFTKGEVALGLAKVIHEFGKHPVFILYAIEAIIIGLFGILKTIYQVYAALAIGQLSDKHRTLLSVGAYLGIGTALAIIGTVFMVICINLPVNFGNYNPLIQWPTQVMILGVFLAEFLQVTVFHIITERILTRKLNLL